LRLHLIAGFVLCLGSLGVFWWLAGAMNDHLLPIDEQLATSLHEHAQQSPGLVTTFLAITALGSQRMLLPLSIIVALALGWLRRGVLACVWLIVVSGGYSYVPLKQLFPRQRPHFADPFVVESSLSFPSGHAMASLVVYGLLGYLLCLSQPRVRRRVGVILVALVWVVVIGFSRLYLGAHYLSDVLGGYAAGLAWLAFSVSLMQPTLRFHQCQPTVRI
jgi:undecaprenyl-diphosphatase